MTAKPTFIQKKNKALEVLAASPSAKVLGYKPAVFSLFWKCGIEMPPPHFSGLISNFAVFFVWYFIGSYLLTVWLDSIKLNRLTLDTSVLPLIFGALFGAVFAVYYKISAKSLQLPSWESL